VLHHLHQNLQNFHYYYNLLAPPPPVEVIVVNPEPDIEESEPLFATV
jgi:hypothetical protein